MFDIKALTAAIEAQFPVGQSTDHALSVTGEPYVVIGQEAGMPDALWVPGVVREGLLRGDIGSSEDQVCRSVWGSFCSYAVTKTGRLYWRIKPRLEQWADTDTDTGREVARFAVYMRLLISDLAPDPEKWAAPT